MNADRSFRARHGFTLVELLVALFIVAIMFALGYGALNQALRDREALTTRQQRLAAVQTTMRVISQDFGQLAIRPVRDRVGDATEPTLRGGPRAGELVALTRGGWANPAGIQRPALQRVSYALDDGKLVRAHWRVLDATLAGEPVRRELLDRVRLVQLRYMDEARQWREEWPPPETGGTLLTDPLAALSIRPIAVEVTLELEDWGRLVRIIEVPG
jgi:general secretion pathway protein J